MIYITTIRVPLALKFALAVLNTCHPGPTPQG